jgi:endonuclease/exonuclease/phosphatase (EEP) superfamily protein YafD
MKYLRRSNADVVLGQEHRLASAAKIAAASRWCKNNGWKSIWAPAIASTKGGEASGGTVIFARSHLGLAKAEDVLELSERAIAAKLDYPGGRRLLLVSIYCKCSIGLKGENVELLGKIGQAVESWGGPAILGGDFNMLPSTLQQAGYDKKLKGKVIATTSPIGTCDGILGARTIDYFVATGGMEEAIESVSIVHNAGLAPHRPVFLKLHPKSASLRARKLRKPQTLPPQPAFGPRWRSNSWDKLRNAFDDIGLSLRRRDISHQDARSMANAWLQPMADAMEGT